jgi:2-polyprenyl-3-methyl-5-hydroxy-6-metoxy-1,4-benzoquinol methylase
MRGWTKTEKTRDLADVSEAWLKGFFHDTHYDWDGITWNRNFAELRTRDVAFMALGDVGGKNILDVGCGDGTYAFVLSKLGATVSGQDLSILGVESANQREYGETNSLKGKFVCADATKLMFESETFDAVFSSDFFEHISLNTKREVIAEIYRVLKPGGIFVIKTPNLDYLRLSIYVNRFLNLLRGRSPFIYIAHTRNNPDCEHHGLTNYREMRRELEGCFFHTPNFHHHFLVRRGLSQTISNFLFSLRLRMFNEHLILSTRKSIFVGVSEKL